jgi:hypothetical protein
VELVVSLIYLAASRDRRLAIGFRGLGNRVCYAWLGAVWYRFRVGWVQRRPELVSICRIYWNSNILHGICRCCLNSGHWLESANFGCKQARMQEWGTFNIRIKPECKSGAHYITESDCNRAAMREWGVFYMMMDENRLKSLVNNTVVAHVKILMFVQGKLA